MNPEQFFILDKIHRAIEAAMCKNDLNEFHEKCISGLDELKRTSVHNNEKYEALKELMGDISNKLFCISAPIKK